MTLEEFDKHGLFGWTQEGFNEIRRAIAIAQAVEEAYPEEPICDRLLCRAEELLRSEK